MRVLFRYEASPEVGLGHRGRCLALATCLHESPGFVGAVAAYSRQAAAPILEFVQLRSDGRDATEFCDVIREFEPDLVVADSYLLDERWFASVAAVGPPLLRLSDTPSPAMGCRYILDPSPAHGPDDYGDVDQNYCRLLVGSRWALLAPDFFNRRHAPIRLGDGVVRVLVSFGAVRDGGAMAAEIIRQLGSSASTTMCTIIEPDESNHTQLRELAQSAELDLELLTSTDGMAEMIARHDVALAAGGVSALERCVIGLPSAIVAVAENQRPNVRALLAAGAAIHCDLDDVVGTVAKLLANADRLRERSREVCDGLGALRTARVLGATVPVRLRRAVDTPDDEALAFGHQSIPGIRASSRHPEAPTWAGHTSWYEDTMTRGDRCLFFVEVGGLVVGQIRTDDLGDGTSEVSILLVPEARGFSIASAAIREVARQSALTLVAYIAADNLPSVTAFRSAGFEPIGADWYRQAGVRS